MPEPMSQAERISALEARIENYAATTPTVESIVKLGQIITVVLAALAASVGLFGIRTFSDLETYAKRQVNAAIPSAAEARIRFDELKAQSNEYQSILAELRTTRDLLAGYADTLENMPSPEGLVFRARAAAATNQHDIAVGFLRQLLDSEQADASNYQIASQIASQELGLNRLARRFARLAYERIPSDPEIESDYLQLTAEDPSEIASTKERFVALVKQHPHSDRLWRSLGNFYVTIVDWEGLRAVSEAAIARAESGNGSAATISSVAYQLRGQSGQQTFEDPEKTRRYWQRALNLSDSRDPNILKQYGNFLVENGRCDQMNEMFESSLPRIFDQTSSAELAWVGLNLECGNFRRACEIASDVTPSTQFEDGTRTLFLESCDTRVVGWDNDELGNGH